MNNTSSTSGGDEQRSGDSFFHNLTRTTFSSLRRLIFRREIRSRTRLERNADLESFERFLREEFSVENTSDIDIAEHLATVHVCYTETSKNCTIYISGYNDGHDKIIDGVVDQGSKGNALEQVMEGARSALKFFRFSIASTVTLARALTLLVKTLRV